MTKQEAIQKAWGKNWETIKDKCDDNGFVPACVFLNPGRIKIDIRYVRRSKFIRPESLKGLNTNNGWTKIESESDLPKEEGQYFVYSKVDWHPYFRIDIFTGKLSNAVHHVTGKPIFTHYQPIQKPQPPIY